MRWLLLFLCSLSSSAFSSNPWLVGSGEFGCSIYSPVNIPVLKSKVFSTVGPVYVRQEEFQEKAKESGVSILYGLNLNKMTDVIYESSVAVQIENISKEVLYQSKNDSILGWYIFPEELRVWKEKELDYLSRVTSAVKENDERGRPVIIYEPGIRSKKLIEISGSIVDVIVKGIYINYYGFEFERSMMNRHIASFVKASKSFDFLPVVALEMFSDPLDSKAIKDYVRHDIFSSLALGAKGIIVYSGYNRKGFSRHGEYLDSYLELLPHVCNQKFGEAVKKGERELKVDEGVLHAKFFYSSSRWDLIVNQRISEANYELDRDCSSTKLSLNVDLTQSKKCSLKIKRYGVYLSEEVF